MKKLALISLFGALALAILAGGSVLAQSGGSTSQSRALQAPTPAGGSATVRIVSPVNDQVMALGDVALKFAADNYQPGSSDTWQVYVDGKQVGQVASAETSYSTSIVDSGPHELKVALVDSSSLVLGSAAVYITTAPATPRDTPFNLAWVAPVMGGLVVFILALIAWGLWVTRRRPG